MTEPGIILGTAAYMSPEQARGTPVDSRTDIWAFGCVLYEMLTGRRAFAGDNVSDVLASVLAREPALAALPDATPPSIRRLLQRCLQKHRVDRLRDIGDARFDIADAMSNGQSDAVAAPVKSGRSVERLAWATALIAAVIAAITFASRRTSDLAELRVDLVTPPTAAPHSTALSPDGRTLAFIATAEGESRLSLRSLPSGSSRTLGGTDGAELPFWSPDGQSVGFFAEGKLRRVEISGGSVQALAAVNRGQGGTWNQDNVILFASLGNPITRIAASGGDAVKLSGLVQQGSDFSPHFLPDGRHFLYYVRASADVRGVYLGELDSASPPRRLLNSDTAAIFAPPGHLLFVVQGTLLAQPFNSTKLELVGNPFTVAEHVARDSAELGVTVSHSGSIAYRESAGVERTTVRLVRSRREPTEHAWRYAPHHFRTVVIAERRPRRVLPKRGRQSRHLDDGHETWCAQPIHVEPSRRCLSDLVARRPARRLQLESKGRPRRVREASGRRRPKNCCSRPRCRRSQRTGHPMATPCC